MFLFGFAQSVADKMLSPLQDRNETKVLKSHSDNVLTNMYAANRTCLSAVCQERFKDLAVSCRLTAYLKCVLDLKYGHFGGKITKATHIPTIVQKV